MKNILVIFLMCPLWVFSQRFVLFSIDSLSVPPVDSSLAHAYMYSPLLYKSQMQTIKSEHFVSKWGFAASMIPSPSYSFSSLDRGWRISLSVSSFVSALKEYRMSRDKIRDHALELEHSRESLSYALLSAYSNLEKCILELRNLESDLETEQKKYEMTAAQFRDGLLPDNEMKKAESDLQRSATLVSIKRLEAQGFCIDIYRISGFIIEAPLAAGPEGFVLAAGFKRRSCDGKETD